MTTTETILNRSIELIWQIRRDRQEAAREQAIRDAIRLEDERARWQQYAPTIQQSGGRVDYEHTEVQ